MIKGSKSMPVKDDNEGGDADGEDQTANSPEERTEQQVLVQAKEVPIQVEESNPGREHKEETTSSMAEDEVQIIPATVSAQQTPSFIEITSDSASNYDKLETKKPRSSKEIPLKCKERPFFEDLSDIFEELRAFYDNILSSEVTI